jgi:hypothetical protein
MSARLSSEVTDLLRSLPEMEPPADAWSRIGASRQRTWPVGSPIVWSGVAVAACAALIAFGLLVSSEAPVAPVQPWLVAGLAPSGDSIDERGISVAHAADLHELRQQSRQLERRLAGLPRRSQVVRADVAGMIAELQDQIAAVDYELNRAGSMATVTARWPSPKPAAIYAVDRADIYAADELWKERVQLMNRLVSVRFTAAGAAAY